MQPSVYQQSVIEWLRNNQDVSDAVVNSVAGSGKSTLLKMCADVISHENDGAVSVRDCVVLVFNKKNKEALVRKLGAKWQYSIYTTHSKGYRILKQYLGFPQFEVRTLKYRELAQEIDWFRNDRPRNEIIAQQKIVSLNEFIKLFELIRLTLCPLNPVSLSDLIEHYSLDINRLYLDEIIHRVAHLMEAGQQLAFNSGIIDHTDMLWLSVQWKINQAPNFSFAKRVFVDEAQDMSNLQLEFVLAIADARSKMLFVGDPSQSINGFCGADANSFENIKSRLSAKEFTLPTCYRCPKSHISLINRLYPEIPIIANDGAENGTIKVIEDDKLWATGGENRVEVGDLVVARRTSTLVDTHLELISRGIPSSLVGSSLCNELIELVREIFWQNEAQYTKFREFAQQYLKTKEAALAKKDNCSTALIHLQDLIKALISIYAHYSSCYRSCEELCQGIRALFGTEDNADTVILSTIHRAKGMEAEKVYILEPIDLPLLWENQQPWQEQQEHNLVYVALSRSTRSLYLVGDAVWFDHQLETQPSSSNSKIVKNHEKNATPLGSIEAFISGAQDNELEKIAKLIEHEQGKRIATKFHNEFSKN